MVPGAALPQQVLGQAGSADMVLTMTNTGSIEHGHGTMCFSRQKHRREIVFILENPITGDRMKLYVGKRPDEYCSNFSITLV